MRLSALIFFILSSFLANAQVSSFKNYSEIKDRVETASIVMLGEVNHSDQTSMIEKVELLKYLYDSLDFKVLAFESSIYDMSKGNDLLKDNIEAGLYAGIFPIWHNTEGIDSLISALKSRRFILVGFDNQICSGGRGVCLELVKDLETFLIKNEIKWDQNFLEALFIEIESFDSEQTISSEFNPTLLEQIVSLANSIKLTNHPDRAFWFQNLISIHGLFFDHYYNKISQKNNETFKPFDSNLRDSLMALNVMYLLDEFPDSKTICWGATYHFANAVQNLNLSDSDFSGAKPMGYYLKKELGDKIRLIGFTDLAKAESKSGLLENTDLFRSEKAIYNFNESSKGKSSFIKYTPYPEGDWAEVIDLGIVINSEGPLKLNGQVVSLNTSTDQLSPVPYALIQIEGTPQGSVANENGMFEVIIHPDLTDRKIIFSSLGYEPLFLSPQEIKSRIVLFEKANLLDEVVITPDQNDPVMIIKELTSIRIRSAPKKPIILTMYNYQEEVNSYSKDLKIRESALEYYYENRLQEGEVSITNILNYRNLTENTPVNPWPYAPFNADLQSGFSFTIDQTFQNLRVDSIYSYERDGSLNVVSYTHLKPNLKTSGFGLTSEWRGKIVYDPETMTMISHYKELHFKKNESFGLYNINFYVEYFRYQDYIFPRLMKTNYQFRNKDGSINNGSERILITDIALENARKPATRIWQFENASSDEAFWKNFNKIPISGVN